MNDRREMLSEEMLNALVDGEFPPEERAERMARVKADDALAREACELRALKEMVRDAYAEPPEPARRPSRATGASWPALAAAVLLGLLGGWFGWQWNGDSTVGGERFVVVDAEGRDPGGPVAAGSEETRIVFHITDPGETASTELLDEVEGALGHYREVGRPVRVEVVAHGEGLGLLRARLSSDPARIARLAARYPMLTFVACRNTIERLRVERGVEVVLLPEARLTDSGVAHLVRRQREGWVYIQV